MAKSKRSANAGKNAQKVEGSTVAVITIVTAASVAVLIGGFFIVRGFFGGGDVAVTDQPINPWGPLDRPVQRRAPWLVQSADAHKVTPGELDKVLANIPVLYEDDDPRGSRPLVEPASLTPVGDDEDLPQGVKDENQQMRDAPTAKSFLAIDLVAELEKAPQLRTDESVIELTGLINTSASGKDGASASLRCDAGLERQETIRCRFNSVEPPHAICAGQVIKLKGRLESGEVSLRDCVLLETGPNPAFVLRGAEFERIQADKDGVRQLSKRNRPFIVTGVLVEDPQGTKLKIQYGEKLVHTCSPWAVPEGKYAAGQPVAILCSIFADQPDGVGIVGHSVSLSALKNPVPFDEPAHRALAFQVTRRVPMIISAAEPLKDAHPVDSSTVPDPARASIAGIAEAKDAAPINLVTLAAENWDRDLPEGQKNWDVLQKVTDRYKGKLLEMQGRLSGFALRSDGKPAFSLIACDLVDERAIDSPTAVTFVSLHPEPWSLAAAGQRVRIRGRFDRAGTPLVLQDGVILETEGPPAVVSVTDEQLLAEFTADGDEAFVRKYDRKTLIVSGTIKQIDDNKINLASSGEDYVRVHADGWSEDHWAGLEAGQSLRVACRINPRAYSLHLFNCFRVALAPE